MRFAALLLACLAPAALSAPPQSPFESSEEIHNKLNPLKHLSAISPFFIPLEKPDPLPAGCALTRVSLLVRHSAILGNDDEYEAFMRPFVWKIGNLSSSDLPSHGPWSFLRKWKTPIVEDKLEKLSERGKKDAKQLGKYIRKQYDVLFPPRKMTSTKRPAYKVWTASSGRDIDTAKAYILGSFPSHQSGDDGEGDGDVVQLIEVPNHAKEWEKSLTPHKACDAFEKESSLVPAAKWLAVYAEGVRRRLGAQQLLGELAAELTDEDVLGMQMLCGYETIAVGESPFCHVFTDDEWRDFEYHQDVRWHHAFGYGSHLSPYLGMPWVKTATHLLEGEGDGDDHLGLGFGKSHLPGPKVPPNATHSQQLHPHFTHRESPGFVAVFLNLFNDTDQPHPSSETPPLDHRVDDRQWRTSHLSSFLGHIALERFHDKHKKGDYVRAVVNGRHKIMGGCEDGVGRSCQWETFKVWVEERGKRWSDWESVCRVDHSTR